MVARSRNRKTEKIEGDFDMLKFLNLDIYCNFFCSNSLIYAIVFVLQQKTLDMQNKIVVAMEIIVAQKITLKFLLFKKKSIATAIIHSKFQIYFQLDLNSGHTCFFLIIDIKY